MPQKPIVPERHLEPLVTCLEVNFEASTVPDADSAHQPKYSERPWLRQTRQRDHISYWAELVSTGAVPDDEYEEHPRGRVAYNEKTGTYTLLADECILGKKSLVAKIVSRLNLPLKNTETGTDSHYKCFRCLSRGG